MAFCLLFSKKTLGFHYPGKHIPLDTRQLVYMLLKTQSPKLGRIFQIWSE